MNMPGFTAELSLVRIYTSYKLNNMHTSSAVNEMIQPQFEICNDTVCCDDEEESCYSRVPPKAVFQ